MSGSSRISLFDLPMIRANLPDPRHPRSFLIPEQDEFNMVKPI
ncbi:hypothetical protein ACFL6S_25570 [Candidatus Poribacteria bacterium]